MSINECYNLQKKNSFQYEFLSDGPKGIITKVIEYQHTQLKDQLLFNLSFGDWDEQSGRANDKAISNNNDTGKVLNTVAISVLHFMLERPDASIFAVGSTLARTRLYQMNISKFINEISILFDVRGLKDDVWEVFEKGLNYQAFLLSNKLLVNFVK